MLDTQSPTCPVWQGWMPLDGAFNLKSGSLAYAFTQTVCLARPRYRLFFIFSLMFVINFVFPHLPLFALLPVDLRWRLVTDAHMRTRVVIEMDETGYGLLCLLKRLELLLWIDIFCLYYTIATFRYRVVRGLVVLGHGDGDAVFLQHSNVGIAAVLYTPVRVVDKPCETLVATHFHSLFHSHLQGLHTDGCLQTVGQYPAHNHVGVGIGDQMQVADITVCQGNIGDVSHPKLVCRGRHKVLYQVLPFMITVIGIGRVTRLRSGKHQPLPTHDHEETVTSGYVITSEHADQHQPQLVAPDTRVLRPDFPDGIEDLALMFNLFFDVCLRLVEGLTAMAK